MKLDARQIAACLDDQSDPEPFSGVVYLTRGEDVLFEGARGFAIRPEAIPNTVRTRFQMASGCKVFTAVAIGQLIERGKLAFDTRLCDCVSEAFPNFSKDVTVGHLLTNSAGITSYFEEDVNPDYEALWRDHPMYKMKEPRDYLPLFQDKPMRFLPGERFEYNDGGFVLLGLIVERVSRMPFTAFVAENVFAPAALRDSGYFATDRLPERTAYAYIENPDGSWRTNFFAVPIVGGPDGGAYTTAPDMDRFWKALTSNRLLNAATTKRMLDVAMTTSMKAPHTHYGQGVWIEKRGDAVRKFFVEGFDPGVAMRSAVYPDTGLVMTVIGNTDGAPWPLWRELERRLDL